MYHTRQVCRVVRPRLLYPLNLDFSITDEAYDTLLIVFLGSQLPIIPMMFSDATLTRVSTVVFVVRIICHSIAIVHILNMKEPSVINVSKIQAKKELFGNFV